MPTETETETETETQPAEAVAARERIPMTTLAEMSARSIPAFGPLKPKPAPIEIDVDMAFAILWEHGFTLILIDHHYRGQRYAGSSAETTYTVNAIHPLYRRFSGGAQTLADAVAAVTTAVQQQKAREHDVMENVTGDAACETDR